MNDAKSAVESLNAHSSGWTKAMGLQLVSISAEHVQMEWTVDSVHLQPVGIVHGGVYCGVIETVCSMGAWMAAAERGHQGTVVGLENHTSFLRATRAGEILRASATPISRGRTTHVWQAEIRDENDKLVATGRVRLLCAAPGTLV